MTREEIIKVFNTLLILKKVDCTKDELEECCKAAIKALEQEPTTKNDLGVDAVSRQAINGYIDYILSHGMGKRKSFEFIKKFVANLPSVTPQEPKIGHCKNCKFFELNSWAACGGIPIIVAHEICKAWGEGCKTKEDGYCFLYEPQESEDK